MKIASFWSWRNDHVKMMLIGLMIGAIIAIAKLYPEQVYNAAYIATAGMVALVVGMIVLPSYIGRGYPHIIHFVLSWPQMIPYVRSYFIEYEEMEPLGKILDIVALMKEDERGYDIPVWWGDRWWWIYRVKTAFGVDTPRYGDVEYHVFMLPHAWDVFFGRPREMPWGAELYGELFTHPSTSWLLSVMAPFSSKHLGSDIPVFLGIAAHHSAERITKNWTSTIREAARYIDKFDEIMEQEKDRVYPNREIEMAGYETLTLENQAKMREKLKRGKIIMAPGTK